ncbi:MAG TPA: hypothetical protein VGS97_02785 [Actinocrinis sp.]|uniref:hypothetical protein n=1 Tax=Actinocrinis sp. TaxID=1920516 RepID=UPI002DDCC770|nr:hypothetical protein [Actinocrinis sp.]HEV2342997.1 hypothetical protein [Actinocrinis sp.]
MSATSLPPTRAARLAGLRQLLGHLDAHPALPLPAVVTVEVHAATDLDGFEQVARAAHQLGVSVTTALNGTQRAAKRFGPATFAVVYHPQHPMEVKR